METLRVAIIDLSTSVGGGHFAQANLAKGLSEKGHEVHVLFGLKHVDNRLKDICSPNCHIHCVRGYGNIFDVASSKTLIKKDIEKICKTNNFEILHGQGLAGLFVPTDMLNRLIVTLHGNNIYRGLTLMRYSLSNLFNRYIMKYVRAVADDGLGSLFYWFLEKKSCEIASKVITLSNFEADVAEKYYRLERDKVRVIPNPVTLPEGEHANFLHVDNEKVLLTVGSLSLIKGTPLIVQASKNILSQLSDVVHVFVGSGTFSHMVRDLATKFPGRVTMIPRASSEIVSFYKNSTLLLHGSLYESFGLVLGEAMLCERPVVAFNVASIPECVEDGVTGYLARPFSAKDLAQKAVNILEDDEKAERMGLMGKRRAEDLYNLQRVAGKVEGIYREVLIDGGS